MENIDKIGFDINTEQQIIFSTSEDRENIDSGNTIGVILGKIRKFFIDLKPVAFSGSYDDLINKPTLSSLGAAAASHSHNYAATDHTHNYAGSTSAGGAATSANKINTNAGSATQPVYFSGGIPKACSYTLGKSVPSNAVFTDTNTWRGIQNVLTSSSTSDSLSANMGRVLYDKVKGTKQSGISFVSGITVSGAGSWGDGSRGNNQIVKLYGSGICIGFAQLIFKKAFSNGAIIGTFPSGFVPSFSIGFFSPAINGKIFNIEIGPSGIKIYTNTVVDDQIFFQYVYRSNPE